MDDRRIAHLAFDSSHVFIWKTVFPGSKLEYGRRGEMQGVCAEALLALCILICKILELL